MSDPRTLEDDDIEITWRLESPGTASAQAALDDADDPGGDPGDDDGEAGGDDTADESDPADTADDA